MKRIVYLLVLISILGYGDVNARQDAAADTVKRNFTVVGGLQYISNITYAGRRDVTSVPIGVPTLTVVSRNGFFLGTAGYFNLSSGQFSADGLGLTPGYIFSLDKDRLFKLSLSGTKYFFKKNSNVILSAFDGSADAVLSYQPKFIKISLNNSYQFGKETNDIVNSFEASKEIQLAKTGRVLIKVEPTASFYAGTQSFSETYYTESVYQRQVTVPGTPGGLGGLIPGQPDSQKTIQEIVTEEKQREVKKYQPLSFMATLPLGLDVSGFQFNFTPYLIVPFNEVQYDDGRKQGNYFLYTAGFLYKF